MCGISGYIGKGNKEILARMNNELHYRGPDDEGFFVDELVGLGQTRLSIIDLSVAGHQPMSDESDTVWIVFNGEIYNFLELRESLLGKYKFKSQTDTEVILHLYEEMGAKVFEKIEGMFAIAIYDKNKRKLILARDRMGKKPLYYGIFGDTLIFASEIKSLMQHPEFKKEINLESLNKYFLYGYIPTPDSIFDNVYKLEAGTYLEFEAGTIKKEAYWKLEFGNSKDPDLNFEKAKNELGRHLNDAVSKRLVADVPLGVFLSGGIDSSTIAYYAQKNSEQKIKTFSIGFSEKSFDESHYAREVAQYLDTEHYEKIFSSDDCLSILPEIGKKLDEPMADASILPTYLLSRFSREQVTVALGGDGGDELFGGYDTFLAHHLAGYYTMIPAIIRNGVINPLVQHLPSSFSNISLDFKLKRFIGGFEGEENYRDARWMSAFSDVERKKLFLPELNAKLASSKVYENIDRHLADFLPDRKEDKFNKLTKLYLRMYMMDQVLVKVDRASMYNSLEVRAPFLDRVLVEFANSLPSSYKIKGLNRKYILKNLMSDKLPAHIVNRKKKGFGMPISDWLAGPLEAMMRELLSEKNLKEQGLFDFKYIDTLIKEHVGRKKDNRLKLWPLIMFQMWYNNWYK